MAYTNNYKPPTFSTAPIAANDPLDLNFCLPLPEVLESERIKLVLFIPSLHLGQYLEAVSDHPELYAYLPYGPFKSSDPDKWWQWYHFRIQSDSGTTLFAIIDKTLPSPETHPDQGGPLAGVMAYLNTSAPNLISEIGHICIFPKWQRSFVTTNGVGLMLIHALGGPWGLRRVEWRANALNEPSVRAAKKNGFKWEGVLRWHAVLPPGTPVGILVDPSREVDPKKESGGRHTALLAMCWDDYNREEIQARINRKG